MFFFSHLKTRLCSISLYLLSVDDHLDYPVPDLLADIVSSEANQVEDGVNIPGIVVGILLRQDGYLQNLDIWKAWHIVDTRGGDDPLPIQIALPEVLAP